MPCAKIFEIAFNSFKFIRLCVLFHDVMREYRVPQG